ncbi:hypothetical protein [Acidianus manzaensis]|uniref:Uncharacterized protein n=1 Tax=Acidianus manzaensis TaxID=282676 RepID=A0A1W6JXS4_9CREN|nr:hypothetical protein [Acidianus manzaensis]ARM75032.1 hypothetical protein B6F84_02635 [Acidianus manzaensis]
MEFKSIINAIIARGTNLNALANLLSQPSSKIRQMLKILFEKYSLSVFTTFNSESFGLKKIALICNNSKLQIETEKKLFIPLLNLFRSDFEENKFINILYYTDYSSLQSIYRAVETLKSNDLVNCEIQEIKNVVKYNRDINCFNFETNKWICENKIQVKSKFYQITPDEDDIKLTTMLQVNPSIPYFYHPHYNHIKKVLEGFMYTLGNKDFIIDAISESDISDYFSDVIWSVEAQDKYILELHVNYDDLEKTINKLKQYKVDFILAPRSPYYAEGYTIPFEIFKEKQWKFPKILIQ